MPRSSHSRKHSHSHSHSARAAPSTTTQTAAAAAAAQSADSIPDTALGLSASEIALLRHHSNIALHSRGGSSTSAAASQAASSQGRLLLDPSSLAALSAHFDGVMGRIRERWEWLSHQTTLATQTQYDRSGNAIALADAEIARFRAILAEIDELENEFEKVRHIGEIVKGFRSRVEGLERRI